MKNLNAPEMPLCTNIIRLQSYLLAPDEVILFDWFIVKQVSFGYKEFHYSQARIEKETRIKRTRQDAIMMKFVELGLLQTAVKENKISQGRVRYFSVDFEVLAEEDILNEIINQDDNIFGSFLAYMKYHWTQQRKVNKGKEIEFYDKKMVYDIYYLMNQLYDSRRALFNDGKLTGKKPDRAKPSTQLQINKSIERKLFRLSQKYNNEAIRNAFMSYTDDILKESIKPNNFMKYF